MLLTYVLAGVKNPRRCSDLFCFLYQATQVHESLDTCTLDEAGSHHGWSGSSDLGPALCDSHDFCSSFCGQKLRFGSNLQARRLVHGQWSLFKVLPVFCVICISSYLTCTFIFYILGFMSYCAKKYIFEKILYFEKRYCKNT